MNVASIARSGMAAASAQLGVAASNIAQQTARTVPSRSVPKVAAPEASGRADAPSVPLRARQTGVAERAGAESTQGAVVPDDPAVTSEYDPGSPYADRHGFAMVPDVNLLHETVDGIMATFAFDANLAVLQTVDETTRRFLDSVATRHARGFEA